MVIRVLVIDDRQLFRIWLRMGLENFSDIRLEWEAVDGPAGIALAADHKPDVAIVDIRLDEMDGVEAARQIQIVSPRTKIILISGLFDELMVAKGMGLGVGGIIAKKESPAALAAYIRRVHAGEFCCSAGLAPELLCSTDNA